MAPYQNMVIEDLGYAKETVEDQLIHHRLLTIRNIAFTTLFRPNDARYSDPVDLKSFQQAFEDFVEGDEDTLEVSEDVVMTGDFYNKQGLPGGYYNRTSYLRRIDRVETVLVYENAQYEIAGDSMATQHLKTIVHLKATTYKGTEYHFVVEKNLKTVHGL